MFKRATAFQIIIEIALSMNWGSFQVHLMTQICWINKTGSDENLKAVEEVCHILTHLTGSFVFMGMSKIPLIG